METFHINELRIVLEDNKSKYQSGDYITGKLVISVNGRLLITIININLNCLAEVNWTEMPGLKSDGHSYHIKRKYLEYNYQLPEEFSGKYFNDGLNEIPFIFRLPESGIPSTFHSTHGSVKYIIDAFLSEPEINETVQTTAEVVVESPFKDNLFLSVGGSTEKELGLLNLGYGSIKMQATIPKKGHTPAELAEIVCSIENNATCAVTPRATLYQTQIYMTGEKHKTVETTVTEAAIGETIDPEMTADSIINLLIPENIPLSMKCPNITVKYFIHVTLDIPHAIDLHLNLPIIITNCFAI